VSVLTLPTRIVLIVAIWLINIAAVLFWLESTKIAHITIASGQRGSETVALTTAIAEVLNEANLGFQITVFESGGSSENIRLLENGRIDMATIQADTQTPRSVVGVASLYKDAYHLIVRNDANIRSFADLPGHRIAIPPATSGQFNSFWFLAAHYGLGPAQLNALPVAHDAANFAMEQGQVDAIFRVRAPGNADIRDLIGDKEFRLVPILQSDALALSQPAISPGVIPLGSYRGYPALPEMDLPTAVLERLLVVRADLDATLVYKVTQALYAHRSDILERSKLAGFIGPLPDDASSVIMAHPGARAYYDREKPNIVQRNIRLMSALLYTVVLLGSGFLALRARWARSRLLRMSKFNHQLMEIATMARHETALGILLDQKQQLIDMLAGIIADLDEAKVNQDEFEHFTFTWQAVDAMLRDRINLLSTQQQKQSPESATT